MGKAIQKAAIFVAVGGLALALLGVVLIQNGPRSFEAISSGVHTAGKIVIFAGLALFLLASVLGRYVAKVQRWTGVRPRAPANWPTFWFRAMLGSAVAASFFAIWMWPLEAVFPRSPLLLPFFLGHWLSLAAFVVAGVALVITSAVKTLVMPTPTLSTLSHPSLSNPSLSDPSSLASSTGGPTNHPLD